MTINYTALLGLAEPVTGTESGTWGDDVNKGITDYLDIAIAGTNTLSTDGDVTLTQTQGASAGSNISATTAQYMQLLFSGARTAVRNITVPATSKIYVVNNSTTGGYAVVVKTGASTGVSIANGERAVIAYNGSDFVKVASTSASSLTGVLPIANGGTGLSAIGANTYMPVSNGTAMAWTNPASISVGNLLSGAANQVVYQTGSGATSFVTAPTTAGTVLGWSGTAIGWVSAPAATSTINIAGGSAGVVPYQSGVGLTSFTGTGTTGQVLTSNGTAAPTWNTLNALPSQAGNAGKYLTTDGTNASWAASGASAEGVIWENNTSITTNYTLTTNKNGLSVGPITIASGVSVTVPAGQRWVIL